MMTEVSVIVPSFNCANHISATIDSIRNQTLQSFELIIVDDGSTDDTKAVVKSYLDKRIKYIYQDNRGVSGARNRGALEARGKFVAFVDADDSVAPETLELLSDILNRSGASWCVTDVLSFRNKIQDVINCEIPEDIFYGILENDFVTRGFFFRRQSLMAIGGYDETLRTREDWDLNIRMIRNREEFRYVSRPLYSYYFRQGSLTSKKSTVLDDTLRVLRKHHKSLADKGDSLAARIYSQQLWELGRRYFYSQRNVIRGGFCIVQSVAYDRNMSRVGHALRHRASQIWG